MGDFAEANLPDFFEFIRNGMSVKQSKECDGLPVTRIETIANGDIDTDRFGYAGLNKSENAKWLLKRGDILFSHINSVEHIGKCALFDMDMDVVHGMNLLCFRPNFDRAEPRYIKWLFRSPQFRSLIMPFVNKAVNQASISIGNLNNIRIKAPPLEEQKRIAAILDQADDIRRKRQIAIDRLNQLGQAIFHEMFGDPKSNRHNFPLVNLGELALNEDGRRVPVKSSDRSEMHGKYPYYGASGIIDYVDNYIFEGERLLIGEDGANLLSRSSPLAFIAKGQFWVNNHAHVLSYNGKANLRFLEYFIERTDISQFVSGSAQPKITQKQLNSILVPCPPIQSQNRFADAIDSLIQKHSLLDHSLSCVNKLFASLQHRSFAGEL